MSGGRDHTGPDEARTARDPRPVVTLPAEGLPGAAIAGAALVVAVALFLVIDARRQASTAHTTVAGRADAGLVVAPPPLDLPPVASAEPEYIVLEGPPRGAPAAPVRLHPLAPLVPAPARVPEGTLPVRERPLPEALPQLPQPPASVSPPARSEESALVIDGGVPVAAPAGGASDTAAKGKADADAGDQAFAPTRPHHIANRTLVVATGTLIPAALETPIDTARPGMVRAITSRDVRGFDGHRVLIPRGSRLIGEYQADVRTGQNRVLVTWTMLVLPDGTQIELKSPAADPLGGAGIPGKVHSYFLARFASALLQSALLLGSNLAVRSAGDGSVIVAVPATQAGSLLGQQLFPSDGYKPKITVRQGAAINVFVARDLDFSETADHQRSGNP